MTSAAKRNILTKASNALAATVEGLGCAESTSSTVMHDTDLSPLHSALGDHITFTISGVIRLEDYLQMHPEDAPPPEPAG